MKSLLKILLLTFAISIAGVNIASAAPIGSVLDFDGNDYLTVADAAVFDQANQLSWSVWVKPDITPSGDAFIIYSANRYYLKLNSSNQIVGAIYYSSAWRTITSSAITIGKWTHIEMTYNKDVGGADELKLYIDAVLSAIGDHSTAIADTNTALYIGSDSTPANYFDGKIDDIRLYQYARTADEIRLDYNAGFAARFGPSTDCNTDPGSCMTKGLVGYWGMDEGTGQTAYDASGNSNNGMLGSNPNTDSADPKWTGGRGQTSTGGGLTSTGGALQFDGVNDYVNAGNAASLNITNAITVEAWVKLNAYTSTVGHIVRKEPSYTNGISDTGKIGFHRTSAGLTNGDWSIGTTIIPLNQWHHVVTVYDMNGAKVYLDGNLDGTLALTGAIDTSANNLLIAKLQGVSTFMFNGTIDEVRIYNRALSAEEIRYHYNRGGPVAEWKFNEGSGTTTYDSTNNNNDGTLNLGTSGNTITSNAWVQGKYGSALSFDGVDDYVQATVSQGTTTVSLWVQNNSVWEHVVKIGNTYYINGISGATPVSYPVYISGTTVQIGKSAASTYVKCLIDGVRIYNYARTPAQILLDYNNGLAAHLK